MICALLILVAFITYSASNLHKEVGTACAFLEDGTFTVFSTPLSDSNLSILHATFDSFSGFYTFQFTIWITALKYPTQENKSCLNLEFEDQHGNRFSASFREDCRNLHRNILRWFENDRDSFKQTPESDPHYAIGSREYGVSFLPSNPGHFAMVYYDRYPNNILAHKHLTNLSYKSGMIRAQQLDKKLELEDITFDAWKSRLNLAMEKYIDYIETHDRVYSINQVVQSEGDAISSEAEMTRKAYLIWRPKEKFFEVTTEDKHLLGKIENASQIEVFKIEENGEKKFDKVCMRFELSDEFTGKEKFRVDAQCELLYYDLLKVQK